MEFMLSNGQLCSFRIDDVVISYDKVETKTVCDELAGEYRFGYQGSEEVDEWGGEGNHYTTFYRQLDPRLGRWLSIDPVVQPWQSTYCSMDNNPICNNDPKGNVVPIVYGLYVAAEIVAAYVTYDITATKMQHSTGNRNVRQTGYTMNHPKNALKASKAGEIASNMSINISREIGHPENNGGNQRNAIRHTIWNAILVKSTGSKGEAEEAVNSHETDLKMDWNQKKFTKDKFYEADKSCDLRNNVIGRRIGEEYKNLSNVEIAKKVLDEYHTNGLWLAIQQKDGTYNVEKVKLPTDEYKKAIAELEITSSETGKHKTK